MNIASRTLTRIGRHLLLAALVVAFVAALVVNGRVLAQNGGLTMRPGDVPWPTAVSAGTGTSGVSGIQTVVVKGDPTKAGLYTLMLRAGPGIRIQAHSHQDDRVATVLKGTWYFAYGDQFDEAMLVALEPGSFYTEPPGVNHFAMTKEDVILQIVGTGPSATTYVDPANDPTRR
jgi:quercetin dioxygenase-like cupin family protein